MRTQQGCLEREERNTGQGESTVKERLLRGLTGRPCRLSAPRRGPAGDATATVGPYTTLPPGGDRRRVRLLPSGRF